MARPLRPQNAFAERLIQARGEMSRIEVAQKLDVNIETLGGYERGKNAPPYSFLADIKALYGVSLDWLITGEGEMRPSAQPQLEPVSTTEVLPVDLAKLRSAVTSIRRFGQEEPWVNKLPPDKWAAMVVDAYQFLVTTPEEEKRQMITEEMAKTDRKAG
ncbi:helix-turn-helix domain-containing protein [Nitrospirillum amazonense]|uniref:helix-turn-helix domain-containing protein n=1 Tax=Nitrospirillum amazonense TaxID=28077 RepID=UPI00241268F7|nr:helix-turn-helix transcriptional regulator [Nitrospirillum amazonense]MDG3444696.1 helix-turn-helix transcriptional regulator [Nitrospirillum amazonense]